MGKRARSQNEKKAESTEPQEETVQLPEEINSPFELFDLGRDIPATDEDVFMQRTIRAQPGENLLPRLAEMMNLRQFANLSPRRTTSEGWEPFELD